ncbi:MAG TPA: hypothetical protein VFA92_00215, partial [Candidatus Binatia bacterium]|nr:hypothetical protein [Candidatus Binatia bacterium]
MTVLVWLHLVGASLWLGGLVTLAVAVPVAARTVPRDAFGRVRPRGGVDVRRPQRAGLGAAR